MNVQIKNRFTSSVIFELDANNNSIALTLKAALKTKADLRNADLCSANLYGANLSEANLRNADLCSANLYGANLSEANLRNANLSSANLQGADLRDANLRNANLRNADLYGANLRGADLSGADLYGVDFRSADLSSANLRGANLSEADLYGVVGNRKELRTIQVDKYDIAFTDSILQIGCKRYTHQEWRNFTDNEISKMDNGALEWWKKWKDFVFKAIELSFGEQVHKTLTGEEMGVPISDGRYRKAKDMIEKFEQIGGSE